MPWPTLALRPLVQEALLTFRRFPFTLLAAFIDTGTLIYLTDLSYEQREAAEHLNKLIITSALGLILCFNLQLFSERYLRQQSHKVLIIILGVVLMAVCYLVLPDKLLTRHWLRLSLIGASLHLMAAYVPFLNQRLENGFWQFNKILFLRLLTAALYTAILFLGIVLAITAIKELFEVDLDSAIYVQCWFFMVGVFNTWFFLAGVPTDFAALESNTAYPKGLKVFTQFVLMPLVTLYVTILYAYLAKIIGLWGWPRGWVSNLILGFSVAGIFSLLLINPIRHHEGNTWIRTYARWFYRALFPLIILFALAIWRRVSQYGITESRYVVLVLAGWLLVVAIYFLWSKNKNIKFIPFTLSLLALLTSFGPWGMLAISERSQTNRLAALLQQYGILQNGQVRSVPRAVSQSDLYQISSILTYLGEKHQYKSIKPWFGTKLDSVLALKNSKNYYINHAPEIMQTIGLTYQWHETPENTKYVTYHINEAELLPIKDYDYLFTYTQSFYRDRKPDTTVYTRNGWQLKLCTQPRENKLRVIFNDQEQIINMPFILKKLALEKEQTLSQAKLTYNLTFTAGNVRFVFRNLEGEQKQAKYKLTNFNATVLIQLAEQRK